MSTNLLVNLVMLELGLVLLFACLVIGWLHRYARPMVRILHKDPPPDAAYMRLKQEAAAAEADGEIERIKVDQILHIALYYNGGSCTATDLWKAIQTHWNSQYTDPEFKQWKITRNFMLENVAALDYEKSGRCIEIAPDNDAGVAAGSYVLMDMGKSPTNAPLGRALVPVSDLLGAFVRERVANGFSMAEKGKAEPQTNREEAKEGEKAISEATPDKEKAVSEDAPDNEIAVSEDAPDNEIAVLAEEWIDWIDGIKTDPIPEVNGHYTHSI